MASNRRGNNNNNNNGDQDRNRQPQEYTIGIRSGGVGIQMGLSELMQFMMMHQSMGEPPEPDFPKSVKCPVCTQEHHYRPAQSGGNNSTSGAGGDGKKKKDNPQVLFSHDARVMYTTGPCPVCLEDKAGPPMVGLACGHLICVECFASIGGCSGADALLSTAEQAIRQSEAHRAERERERENQRQQWQESQQQQSGTESNERPPWMDLMQQSNTGVNLGPGMLNMLREMYNRTNADDDDDDQDNDDDDDDDSEDIPPLLPLDVPTEPPARNNNNSSNTNNNATVTQSNMDAPRPGTVQDEEEDNDDYDDMPPLVPGNPVAQLAPVAPDDNSSSSEEDDDVRNLISRASGRLNVASNIPASSTASRSRNNVLSARRPQSAGPFSRDIRSSANDSSDDEDDPSIPALIPRSLAGQAATRQAPPTIQRHADDDDDDDSNDSSAGSSQPPELIPPSQVQMEDESDDDDLPELKTQDPNNSDDDDDDSDEPPPLVPSTTHAPGITQVPSAVRNVRQSRTVASTQVPAAASPARAAPGHVYGPPRPPAAATVARQPVSAAAAAASPAAQAADSKKNALEKKLAERKRMRERYYNELMTKARDMKTSKLKRELRSLGVSTINFVEKTELFQAYAEAMTERKYPVDDDDDEDLSDEEDEEKNEADSNAVAIDPFAGLPKLLPAQTPPYNGTWILSPTGEGDQSQSTTMELSYCFASSKSTDSKSGPPEQRSVTMISHGQFPKGSVLTRGSKKGSVWVQTPPVPDIKNDNDNDTNNNRWLAHQIFSFDLKIPMYSLDTKEEAADLCVDGCDCVWALVPQTANLKNWNLQFYNPRYSKGKTIQKQIPNSFLYPDSVKGVWMHIHQTEAARSTLQPGLWYFTFQTSRRIVITLKDGALIAPVPTKEGGVWTLTPAPDSSTCLLSLVPRQGDVKTREINIEFSQTQVMVDDGNDSVYLHCRIGDRWKLCRASLRSTNLSADVLADCPKTTRVVADGAGGVWMWRKVGKTTHRTLSHVDGSGNIAEYAQRFPSTATMA